MKKRCAGSADKSPPKMILWKTVPHRLFFGRDKSDTWGDGGVAFLHPESNIKDKAYVCLYRITLEQFNDVLLQENGSPNDIILPLFDLKALSSVKNKQSICVEVLKEKKSWYQNVVYLGEEHKIPILTMTCSPSAIEDFKSGKVPLRAPSKPYANTLVKGLVEGKQLSKEEAMAYIHEASTKPNPV